MYNPLVSVIINFYNDVDNFDMAPSALTQQTYHNFELIFIDDGSTDQTMQRIYTNYHQKLVNMKIIRNDHPMGLINARTQGVKEAKGEIIITLDLHTTFDNLFLERIVDSFSSDIKVAIVGSLIVPYGGSWHIKGYDILSKLLFSLRQHMPNYNYVYGTAAAYRSDALKKIGYFSGDVVEDVDSSWKIKKEGLKILTLKNNVVYHKGPQSFVNLIKSFIRDSYRSSLILKKYKYKFFYPQYIFRFLIIPLIFILLFNFNLYGLFFASTVLISLIIISYLISNKLRHSFFFTIIFCIYMLVSSFSLYYCFITILSGNTNISDKWR